MEELNFTEKERLFLITQLEILNKFSNGGTYYDNCIKILKKGFVFHYEDVLASFIEDDVLPTEECEFVLDVLNMYTSIAITWGKNRDNLLDMNPRDFMFPGFYYGSESKYADYCDFFINDLDRFNLLKRDNYSTYDSVCMIPKYKAMLEKYNSFDRKELTDYKTKMLSLEQVFDLLKTTP